MSLVRLLPAWLHAVADYAVGITLILVALLIHASDKAVAAGVVIGAVVLVVSLLTKYPLGVIKVVPFKVHSAADYLAVVLLIASPFALSFTKSDKALTIVYIAAGIAVLAVSLITNYQYSPSQKSAKAEAGTGAAPAAPEEGDPGRWYAAAAPFRQATASAPTAGPAPAPAPGMAAPSPEAWREVDDNSGRGREAWRNLPDAGAPARPARQAWQDEPAAAAPVYEEPEPEPEAVAEPEPEAVAPAYSAPPDRAGITLEEVLAELAALQRPSSAA
jgi:hypothetical protein